MSAKTDNEAINLHTYFAWYLWLVSYGDKFTPPENSAKTPSHSKIIYGEVDKGFENSLKGTGDSFRAPPHYSSLFLYVMSLICEHL